MTRKRKISSDPVSFRLFQSVSQGQQFRCAEQVAKFLKCSLDDAVLAIRVCRWAGVLVWVKGILVARD